MAVKRILHVIPSVGSLRGGPSIMVRGLALNLSRLGIETHIATTNDNGPGKLEVPCGVPLVEGGVTYWYFQRQTRFYTFSWPLSQWLSNNVGDFDLVHIHALFSYATLPAAYAAHRSGVPYIVRPLGTLSEWGMRNRRPLLKRLSFMLLERRILEYAALVHYTSEQERLEAGRLNIGTATAVIPNALPEPAAGVARGRFRELYPILNGRCVILFLSRIDVKKGLEFLLPAFAALCHRRSDLALVIAGNADPGYLSSLKDVAAKLGVHDRVVWAGFVGGQRKSEVMADSDIFVLPSHSENFGIAVAEAMAAGLPVVVSDQVGIHREISRTGAGLVVPLDVDRLASALEKLVGDPRLRRAMGLRGRELAEHEYSHSAVTERILSAYNGIVA